MMPLATGAATFLMNGLGLKVTCKSFGGAFNGEQPAQSQHNAGLEFASSSQAHINEHTEQR